MAQDIVELCDELELTKVNVLGHSLGGKVAIRFAEMQPERLHKLVVVDISPRQYFSQHTPLMDAMMALDMTQLSSRKEVDVALAPDVSDPAVRQFLLMNLQSDENGLSWRINLPALKTNYQALMAPVCEQAMLTMPSQFIYGGQSEYVTPDDRVLIEQHFTQARFDVIDKAGHWVHAERPQQFKQLVEEFLRDD
jgi:pimeloyl-ACP methyl ester carboxylesterase